MTNEQATNSVGADIPDDTAESASEPSSLTDITTGFDEQAIGKEQPSPVIRRSEGHRRGEPPRRASSVPEVVSVSEVSALRQPKNYGIEPVVRRNEAVPATTRWVPKKVSAEIGPRDLVLRKSSLKDDSSHMITELGPSPESAGIPVSRFVTGKNIAKSKIIETIAPRPLESHTRRTPAASQTSISRPLIDNTPDSEPTTQPVSKAEDETSAAAPARVLPVLTRLQPDVSTRQQPDRIPLGRAQQGLYSIEAAPALPSIHVTIGRVEVRAVPPPSHLETQTVPRRRLPALSLEAYLKARNEGKP